MPVATINPDQTSRRELKSIPDGYVVLRRMPYGQYLHRQEMAMQLKIEATRGQKKTTGTMDMVQRKVTAYEFKECIVDHNLTDENENPLDFNSPQTFNFLDPRVGDEIGTYINELHQFDVGNSPNGSSSSSEGDE